MPRISLDEIQSVTIKALLKHGAREWIATSVSKAVRRAEETGNVICGLYYLQSYCENSQGSSEIRCAIWIFTTSL